MKDRAQLERHERDAVVAALRALVATEGNQSKAAQAINIAQPTIAKALGYKKVGRDVADNLCQHLRLTMPELLAKYGDPYPERAKAIALAREAGVSDETCQWLRGHSPAGGRERSTMWWLRAALTAEMDELVTPSSRLASSEVEQRRVARGLEGIEPDATSDQAPAAQKAPRKRR